MFPKTLCSIPFSGSKKKKYTSYLIYLLRFQVKFISIQIFNYIFINNTSVFNTFKILNYIYIYTLLSSSFLLLFRVKVTQTFTRSDKFYWKRQMDWDKGWLAKPRSLKQAQLFFGSPGPGSAHSGLKNQCSSSGLHT